MSQVAVESRPKALVALLHPATLFVLLMLLALRAFAGSVTLAWDPVSSSSVAGYIVHYGSTAGNYSSKIDVGNTTTSSMLNLNDGATYHFAVTAYDASHTESAYSNDVSATIACTTPPAGFTASTTSGVAPLALNFTSTSTGDISRYAWTFGDGTTSTAQNPSHLYSAAGTYTVSLALTGCGGSNTVTKTNYITVTVLTSDTSPPTAPASLAASASGSTSVNLTWTASSDNVGVTGYMIERCQGAACSTFAQIATVTARTFGDSGLAAGTSYSYRARATDAAGNLSSYSNIASAATSSTTAPGALSGGYVLNSNAVDLSGVGATDWVQWAAGVRRSSGGQISALSAIGPASPSGYRDSRTTSWTDGTPATTGSSASGLSVNLSGAGFQVTVPADTTPRTLTVYVGVQSATGTLTAHLSDGSAADYVQWYSARKWRKDGVYTLTYSAASPGQTLTIKWMQTGGSGNVSLQAAALAGSTSTPTTTTASCPCSIWSATATPAVAADPDSSPVELGVKFTSDVAGFITGIRFYKSSTNTGTHIGSLWTSTGTLLAQGTFTNETASGWQTLTFNSPVAISANTLYVASYHTNVGHYAGDNAFFAIAGVDNPPLHALKDGASGGNGVYAYTSTPVFPTSTWSASNYWVDVVFTLQ
jgi:PKD repeat protein